MRWQTAWRRFRFNIRRERPGRGEGLLLSAIMGIGLALFFIYSLNQRVLPLYSTIANTRVSNAVTRMIEQTVSDYITGHNIRYQDIITLEKDDAGAITALTGNMARLNTMRNEITVEVLSSLDNMDVKETSIPFGNLTGIVFLSNVGFRLPVRLESLGNARSEFHHSFTSAGINQTHHQIMLDVYVTVNILLPGNTITTEVSTQVCAAETIIVGGVPDTFLQLGK